MQTTWTPIWRPGITNAPAYCQHGQHFVAVGEQVWRLWTTPLKSTACICHECYVKAAA